MRYQSNIDSSAGKATLRIARPRFVVDIACHSSKGGEDFTSLNVRTCSPPQLPRMCTVKLVVSERVGNQTIALRISATRRTEGDHDCVRDRGALPTKSRSVLEGRATNARPPTQAGIRRTCASMAAVGRSG